MAKGFKSGGGGSLPAGLKIVGNPRPSNPKEGIVWANTDVEITGCHLSATSQENPTQGMLWIKISDAYSTKVGTPLGNDYITIMLNSVSQYIGGEWVDVEAKSFQNGVWVDWWKGELYKLGNKYERITGGWGKGKFGGYPNNLIVTELSESVKLSGSTSSSSNGGEYFTKNKIDLTNVREIGIHVVEIVQTANKNFDISVNTVTGEGNYNAAAKKEIIGTGWHWLDVSAITGAYYVIIGHWMGSNLSVSMEFDEVRMVWK